MKKLMILAIALMAPALATAAEDRANLNDAQVAAIVVAANQIDIDAGKLAESKSPNPEVKAFAHRMIGEHTDDILKSLGYEASEIAALHAEGVV